MIHRKCFRLSPPAIALPSLLLALALPASAQTRPPLDIQIFATIGEPGQPEGVLVLGDEVYVGTHTDAAGSSPDPSKFFVFSDQGVVEQTHTIVGQDLEDTHGILGMASDANGIVYVPDRHPPRIIGIDPATGGQFTYATFRDVAPCTLGGTPGDCSAGVTDLDTFPDYPVFAPDGTMYVTDLEQALIWRVPVGGGPAEVWFTDAVLEGAFGPNGIQFLDNGDTLLFAQTGSQPPGTTDQGVGVLYTLGVNANGTPGTLAEFWRGVVPAEGPDGFAIAASGNVYVALAGVNQLMKLSPTGVDLARVPATPAENNALEVPMDTPASVAFLGDRLLVTNQSFFAGNSNSWAVYDIFADEPGLPLFMPLPEPGAGAALAVGALLLATLRRRRAPGRSSARIA